METVETDAAADVWWDTTIQGNALAMAGFGKPINRKTSGRLVSELPERARAAYNADLVSPCLSMRSGSLAVTSPPDRPAGRRRHLASRTAEGSPTKLVADYTRASERSFNTYVDRLLWLHTALVQHLKNQSAFINITTEDITRLTDRSETIYSIDTDPLAVSPPADRILVSR